MKISFLPAVVLLFLLSTAFAQNSRILLAVSDLDAQGVKKSEASVISEQLRVELSKSNRIRLIERSRMKEILKEQGFQQSGCTNDACAVEVGQLLGVKNIVIGSIGMAGSYTLLSVRIIDVATGEIVINESVRTRGGIDKMLENGVQQASSRLHSGLFPDTVEKSTEPRNIRLRKALLFGGGGALLVGGGIAAVLATRNGGGETNDPSDINTRVVLP